MLLTRKPTSWGNIRILTINSDPEPTGREHDVLSRDVVYKSDTEVLNNTASFSGGQQMHFLGAGEPIGDVNGCEQEISNLCDDPGAPFSAGKGSGLPLGSLRVKYLSHESTNTSRVA